MKGGALRATMFVALAWLAGFVWFVLSLPEPAPVALRTDGIVVLTGGPGRIGRGVELLQAGSAKRLLISGVAPSVRPIELAVGMDIPPRLFDCCIDLGKRAADTRGNGAEIAEWVAANDYRSIRLVTSQFHMARAVAEARARTGDAVTIVSDPIPDRLTPRALAVEYSKFIVRRALLLTGAQ